MESKHQQQFCLCLYTVAPIIFLHQNTLSFLAYSCLCHLNQTLSEIAVYQVWDKVVKNIDGITV